MQKDEIKEILDELKNEDNYIEDYGFRYKRIALDDVWYLLDYITNLQEENERLKRDKNMVFDANCDLSKVMNNYKTRNEKAIEKCKNKQYETNAPWLIKFAKDVENLLQGKSDE